MATRTRANCLVPLTFNPSNSSKAGRVRLVRVSRKLHNVFAVCSICTVQMLPEVFLMVSSGMDNDQSTDLLQRVTREMRLMSSFDALFSHAVAERVGMHNTDIETLDLLNVLGPMTAGQLSASTGLSSGATTRLIDRLERAGFVRRVPDEADRRRVFIQPIYERMASVAGLYRPMADRLAKVWSEFSDDELEVVLRFARESNAAVAEANAELRSNAES